MPGFAVPPAAVDWRDHLFRDRAPASMLLEVAGAVAAGDAAATADPRALSLQQATEGVRRLLFFLNPQKFRLELSDADLEGGAGGAGGAGGEGGVEFWSEVQCRAIALSLLRDCGVEVKEHDEDEAEAAAAAALGVGVGEEMRVGQANRHAEQAPGDAQFRLMGSSEVRHSTLFGEQV